MNFKPVERKAEKLLPKGDYDFVVIDAEETQSAAGNPMIVLTHEVSNGSETARVRDYLVAKRPAKLRNAVEACGFGDRYHTGPSRRASSWGGGAVFALELRRAASTRTRTLFWITCLRSGKRWRLRL